MNIKNCVKNVLCLTLLFAFSRMNGQDRIITVDNDTIDCRILSISETHLNYEQPEGKYTVGKFIAVSQVLKYYKGETVKSVSSRRVKQRPVGRDMSSPAFKSGRHWQTSVQFGGAYLLASSDESGLSDIEIPASEIDNYYRRLRNGMYFGASVHYIPVPLRFGDFGAGIKYRLSYFSTHLDAMIPSYYSSYYSLSENERMYISYYAVSSFAKIWLGNSHKFRLSAEASVGYAHYRDETRFDKTNTYLIDNFLLTGHTVGMDVELSFSYHPLKYLSISANTGCFAAVFSQMTYTDRTGSETSQLDSDHYENVSQLNYSIGVQFHF
ncbi:MAG: hypothetical protein LBK97_00535 [Prevotellaceae bacterium]|jgi:hypothetical protein|nr:hypothetical protein [Prevotellaceae bacterium]